MPEIKHKGFGSVGAPQQPQENQQENQPTVMIEEPMQVVDLRSLIELGCIRDTIKIGNMAFQLKSLNASERLMAVEFIGDETDAKRMFQFNLLVLSMSIESVNGILLETLYEGPDTNDLLVAKKNVIATLHNSVMTQLLNFYTKITDRADAEFTLDQVKK